MQPKSLASLEIEKAGCERRIRICTLCTLLGLDVEATALLVTGNKFTRCSEKALRLIEERLTSVFIYKAQMIDMTDLDIEPSPVAQVNDTDASILAILIHRPSSVLEVGIALKVLSVPSAPTEMAIGQSIKKLQTWGLIEPHGPNRYRVPSGAMAGLEKIIGNL
jgi:hypothetical protein